MDIEKKSHDEEICHPHSGKHVDPRGNTYQIKCSKSNILRCLKFLYVLYMYVGIPLGTTCNCVSLLANLFCFSYKTEFKLRGKKKSLVAFNSTLKVIGNGF